MNVNALELKQLIKMFVANNEQLMSKGQSPIALNIEGEAGGGKTSVVRQVAKELGMELVFLNPGELSETADLVGFPFKEFEFCNNSTSKCEWVPDNLIHSMVELGYTYTGNYRQSYAVPRWIKDAKPNSVLLVDDFTRGSSEIQQALMRIILEQGFVSWSLPENCHVILTSNPDNGEHNSYNLESLDWAQATRFLTIEYKTEAKIWASWAEGNEVPSYAINFVLHMPEVLEDEKFKMNSRILTLFFHSLVNIDPKKELWYLKALGEKATSQEFISAFTSFIVENDELMSLLTPEQILNNNIKGVFEFVQKYRGNQAILGMLIFRLENYIRHRVSKGTFTDNEAQQYINLIVEAYEKDKMFTKDMVSAIVLNTWSIDNRLKTLATKLPVMFRNIMIGDI